MVTRSLSPSPNLLLRLSGAQMDVLERTPTDRAKFYGVGVSILTSACVAGVSMAYAVSLAFQANPWITFAAGTVWGVAMLRLNYWLVASLPQLKNLRSLFLMALPRMLMAVLFGAIVSVPFVLQIFSPEIRAEIPVVQHEQFNAFLAQQRTSPLELAIMQDQAKVSRLQAVISAGGVTDPFQNQVVQNLNAQLNTLETKKKADYAQYVCQLYGGPGCIPGNGPAESAARANYESDLQQIAQLNQQISTAVHHAAESAKATRKQTLAEAFAELPGAQKALAAAEQQQVNALASFNSTNTGTGLLIQLKVLSALSSGNSTFRLAQILLSLTFVLIDCLPVLTRVLIQFGPETSYDKVLAMENSMTLRVNEDVVAQREARLLREAEKTIDEAAAKFAAEAAARLREHPEEITDGPTSLYRSLLSDEPRRGLSARAKPPAQQSGAAKAGLAPFAEQQVPHEDGQLWRLELGDDEFVLVDSLNGIPTLNWTAATGVRDFALLVSERIDLGERKELPGTMLISVDGAADEVDARLGVRLASLATASLDRRCEFIRFDDHQVGMALQNLSGVGADGEQARIFGISSAGLTMDSVVSLIARTATGGLRAHALAAGSSPLIARLTTLVDLRVSRDAGTRYEL